MSSQLVPLNVAQNQTFTVQLTVNGAPLTLLLTLVYYAMAGYWSLKVANSLGVTLLASVPLVTGWYPAANVLAQYQYLNIGSAYVLNTGNSPLDYPDQNSLGQFSLLWADNA